MVIILLSLYLNPHFMGWYLLGYITFPITIISWYLLRNKFKKKHRCLECDSENDR